MAYCCMSINKIKSLSQLSAAYNHNFRVDGKIPENADPSKTYLNHVAHPMAHNSYNEAFKEFTLNLGYGIDKDIRKNAVLALEIIMSFSREKLKDQSFDLAKWENASIEWVKSTFNAAPEKYGQNLISAVTHYDETTPHISAIIFPVDEIGHLNANFYLKGGRSRMSELQTSYAEFMKPLGLKRGQIRSGIKHQDIKLFYGEVSKVLKADIPKYEETDTPESYQEKIRKILQEKAAISLRLEKEHEATIARTKAAHEQETAALKKQVSSANRKIHKMEKEKEELEREIGTVESVKRVVKSVQLMKKALDEMDIDKANEFTDQLNEMVARQRRIERAKAEKEKKRKKHVFEKL